MAFFEYPSSLTWTSDIRHRGDRITVPCGYTEGIEMICFILIAADTFLKVNNCRMRGRDVVINVHSVNTKST